MPVTTDTLWNIKRLNKIFGAAALVALLSFGWMMWHDYSRPWRQIQTSSFNVRSALWHLTALSYETDEAKARHAELKDAVARAQAELDAPEKKRRIEELERKSKELNGRLQGVSLTYGNRNAEMAVTTFMFEEMKAAHGPNHEETKRFRERFDAETAELERLKKEKDAIEDELRVVNDELKSIFAVKSAADKALQAYEKGLNDAVARDKSYGPGAKRFFLNMPILDAFPTKDTPGRQEIKQVFMPDIRVNYNFTDSYATDRCMTCHFSIDDPTFSRENFVARAEEGLRAPAVAEILREKNKELVQELDRRLADVSLSAEDEADPIRFVNRFVNAANIYLDEIKRPRIASAQIQAHFVSETPDRGKVQSRIEEQFRRILAAAPPEIEVDGKKKSLSYAQMSPSEQDDYFKALTAAMNLYLRESGRPEAEFKPVLAAHPRLDLFVSATSPHPMKKMGCTVCHEGSGQDTDFVLAAHTPANEAEKEEWKKYYVKELGLPLATFHLVEEFWERPMLLNKYVSASCVKCHDQVYDLERAGTQPVAEASNIVHGRELFTKVGCINCHSVQGLDDSRRVGTDLTHVGSKLSTGFIERWVDYPNNFRPGTRMPHFFHQENSTESSKWDEFDPDPELRGETEVKAIAHYLKVFSKPWKPLPLPEGVEGDPKRGEELLTSIGCLACHVDLDAKDPLDSDGRSYGERWIVTDIAMSMASDRVAALRADGKEATIEQRQAFIDEAMPEAKAAFERMSKNDRSRYAARRFPKDRRQKAALAARTETFLADTESRDPDPLKTYVPPEFQRHGPELTGMGTKLVNDPNDENQVRRAKEWLYTWLENPRHYSSYTLMPRLFRENYYEEIPPAERKPRNDQDIMDIASYLLSLRNDDFKTDPLPATPEHDTEMERLILMLLGGQNTESVANRILNDEKLDPGEEYGTLTRSIISQTYKSFGGDDAAKAHVAQLIESTSGSLQDRQKLYFGMKMISHYGCYACHTIAGFEEATRPGTELTTWAQKFLSQLDFAFFSPVFEHEREKKPSKWANLYLNTTEHDKKEFRHLIRDIGETANDLVSGSGGAIPASGNVPHEILHNHASFAYHKIRNPRIWDRDKLKKPYEKLKMPNYFFTEAEARALTTYLLSRRDPDVRSKVQIDYKTRPEGRIARGRALAHELNCIGCHTIEADQSATIQQYYSDDPTLPEDFKFSARFKPPLLWGEGAKVQNDWLYSFLNNVIMLRPWLVARMPSFHLTTEDATVLVEYFAGLSEYEADLLHDKLAPLARHLQEVHAGAGSASMPPWFTEEKFGDLAAFAKDYAIRHKQSTVFEFDTSDAESAADANQILGDAFNKAIGRQTFLASVFDIEYPYSDSRNHAMSDERFKLGEEFFYDLKCLACHVGGDPTVPGTTTDIKAPNFALAHKRLRYDWIIKWLQDPQAIQPGANMPQIFQNGGTAHASLPAEQREEKEAKYGRTLEEQAHLLVDFLFELGERRYTAIQPGATDKPADDADSADDVDFDFGGGGDEQKKDEEVEFDFDG